VIVDNPSLCPTCREIDYERRREALEELMANDARFVDEGYYTE
jgi:hypothetical protein